MDRVDVALVAAVDEVLHHGIADLAVFGRGTDHGNRLRLHDAAHGRDDLFGRARLRLGHVSEVDDDADVGGDRILCRREHRVEIELDHLGEISDELRDLDDDIRKRRAVHRLAAANALQNLMRLDAVEHRQRVLLGRGRQAEGDVLQDLDQHAAKAEGNQLAERSVGDRPDDHFGAAGQHLLHLDALDLGIGFVLLGVAENGLVGLLGVFGRLEADDDAAGFGLVENVRRDDLHHHREAHGRGHLASLAGRLRHALLRHRNAVGVADQLAFRRGQAGAVVRLDLVKHLADGIFGIGHVASPWTLVLSQSARVLRLPVMLANRRALFHVAERSGASLRLLRSFGSKMAGDGIWYARSQLVKLQRTLECCKK
ncbi:hypothetical protein ACVWWG_005958 [Bradyrhizobium sp. LB7.2]